MPSKFLLLPAVCLSLTSASLTTVRADAASDAKKAIQNQLNTMASALNKKDAKGFTQFYAADYVSISKNGARQTLQQEMQGLDFLLKQAKSMKFTLKLNKLALKNGKALTTATLDGVFTMANPQTKKDSKLEANAVQEMTWVKSGNAWRIKQAREISNKSKIDGQPMPGM
jgi:ketosteroid isomerase-like protein